MQKNNQISLSTIVESQNGELLNAGNMNTGKLLISGISDLDKAGPEDLSFLTSAKYFSKASNSQACLILAPKELKPSLPESPFLLVDNVWSAIIALLPLFHSSQNRQHNVHPTSVLGSNVSLGENVGIGPMTVIADNAVIGDNCFIDAQCYIGENVVVESNSLLYPGVKLLMDTVIGKNCIIHAGAVLGADGFRFEVIDGIPEKIPQVGNVIIGDNVEIGANTCIDRAFIGSTTIGEHSKIDNLVHVAHNCEIGPYNGIAGQVGIAGSVKSGAGVMFWGHVAIAENVTIAEHTTVFGGSRVISDIDKPKSKVLGYPAMEHKQYLKMMAALKKLPQLIRNMKV